MIHLKSKEDTEVITKIADLLEWYYHKHNTAPIEDLLNFQDRLSMLTVNLAKIAADYKGSYLSAYFTRKISFSTSKLFYVNDGDSGTIAQEKAELKIKDIKQEEIEAEQASYSISLELKQANKVLQSVQQRISYEKAEKDRLMKLSHDNKTQ